jgi:hypothetical protein
VRRDADVPAADFNGSLWRAAAMAAGFLVSIPVAFATHWAYAIWGIAPTIGRIIRRR